MTLGTFDVGLSLCHLPCDLPHPQDSGLYKITIDDIKIPSSLLCIVITFVSKIHQLQSFSQGFRTEKLSKVSVTVLQNRAVVAKSDMEREGVDEW